MAKAIINEQSLTDIADAIRAKNGSADTYTPAEMATAITDLPSGANVGLCMQIRAEKITTEANSITEAASLLTYLQNKVAEFNEGTLIGWSLVEKIYTQNVFWGSAYTTSSFLPSTGQGMRYRNGTVSATNYGTGYDAYLPAGIDIVLYIAEYDYTV